MRTFLTDHPVAAFVRRWWTAIVVAVPIGVAAVRAAVGDWLPIGDDAYFTVRARDVLTSDHPWVGAWSSGSLDLETPINNLGPIQIDALAPFTRWTPMGGTAIGTAVVNIAAIAAIAWLVARVAGRRALPAAMAGVALLTWTMGSEMLITPRQHQAMLLPYLCLLVAAWAVASGDRWAIVVAVAAGSLVVQTHLSYPVLVAALTIVMVAGQLISTRHGEAQGGRRPLAVAGVLAGVLWIQPVIDQFAGFGNLGHVLFGSGGEPSAGLTTGARIVAGGMVSTDMVLRPGYRSYDDQAPLAAGWQSVVFWVALVAVVVVLARLIAAGRWRQASAGVVAVTALLAGVIDAALLPPTVFGLAVGNYRWLWPTGAFVLMLVLVAGERWLRTRSSSTDPGRRRVAAFAAAAAAALCVVPSVANLPRSIQHTQTARYLAEQRNVGSVLDQLGPALDAAGLDGPVVIDESEMYFAHPFTYPILVEMQEHDIDFRFDSPLQARRFGNGRVADGSEIARLRLISGDPALALEGAPDVVAFVSAKPTVAVVLDRV